MAKSKLLILLALATISNLVTGQTTTENYVKSTSYRVKTLDGTTNAETQGSVTSNDKIESITYFDGLGRPKQTRAKQAGGNYQDIVTPMVYDEYGRQVKEYLPYANAAQTQGSSTLNYTSNTTVLSSLNTYYSSKFASDINGSAPNPYSEKGFEESPLSRVMKQAAPGYDWRLGGGHEIEFGYVSNSSSEVKKFEAHVTYAGGVSEPVLALNGTYAAQELFKTVTYDENHTSGTDHSTEEFKDLQGRVVLKRTYNGGAHDTYYVYDDYGNLTYVLPPKAVDVINPNSLESSLESTATVNSGNSLSLTTTNSIVLKNGFWAKSGSTFTATIDSDQAVLDELCYQYKYDERNRLVEKKIPGKGWEYIVYNKLDQPILTQDANLREQDQWLFTKYDAFGRVAYTGMVSSSSSRATLQSAANATSAQYVTQDTSYASIGGANVYYSGDSTVYPTSGITEVHTINYYDSYVDVGSGTSETAYGVTPITNVKGLATVSKVKVLDVSPAKWITTVSYYDNKSRPIYVYSYNAYLETTDKLKSDYGFNDLLETTSTHAKTGHATITVVDTYTYDHMGRLKTQKQKVDSQPDELIVLNTYDELGQLTSKKVGGDVAGTITSSTGLQTVDYTYNIRGWLKQINNPTGLGSDLFSFKLNYNTVSHHTPSTGKELYNGNISETEWRTANTDNGLHWYKYEYDALNRLDMAIDDRGKLNETMAYDKNGNITTLVRLGHVVGGGTVPDITNASHFGTMDDLVYTYDTNSNKLKKVLDNGEDDYGFVDGSNTTTEYTYDANGNMVTDANKGITDITYNHLNLPDEVQFGSTNKIKYIYDATGVKQSKQVVESGYADKYTYYAGNYVYEGSSLKFFSHPEGYVEPVNPANYGSGYNYVYQYKDHLGNIRLSYQDMNQNNASAVSLQILTENNYYPFGLRHKGYNNVVNSTNPAQDYTFNGKEEQEELGLNWHDFGARNYDATLGRWMNIDNLAGKWAAYTPYGYTVNNPVYYIDPNGEDVYLFYAVESDKEEDNSMFWQAALTRAMDLLASDDFGEGDTYKAELISDLGELEESVEDNVKELSPKYGKTKEFGIWSHAGLDGPIGSKAASKNPLYEGSSQLSMKGWGQIDFNWVEDGSAVAGFYGCNTGNDIRGSSFATLISGLPNYKDVEVLGQTTYSYPSRYTNVRNTNAKMREGNFENQATYMVGGNPGSINGRLFTENANPIQVNKNGKVTGYKFQSGKTYKRATRADTRR